MFYSTLYDIFHSLALSLAGFYGFEVLRAVLMRTAGFWCVNTLTVGVTVTTRHDVGGYSDHETRR